MAIAILMDFSAPGLDALALYDQANERMQTKENPPEGLIFHWAAKTDDGMRIVDVWESQAAFDHFLHTQLGPTTAALGIPQPNVTVHTVHNTIVGDHVAA